MESDMNDIRMMRLEVEAHQKWYEEIQDIPFINFPAEWGIKIIPPFGDACVRFVVIFPTGEEKSVYLDTRETLGYFGGPYWEVYPYNGDVGRCSRDDVESLLIMIGMTEEEQK